MLYAADGKYLLGDFDGKTFKPDSKEKKQLWYGRFYAAQSFDNASLGPDFGGGTRRPDPRRVQIGWAQGVTFPGTPFNQQMTVPVELRLEEEKDGHRLTASPAHEFVELRDGKPVVSFEGDAPEDAKAGVGKNLGDGLDAFEADFRIELGKATGFTLDLRGTKLIYDAAKGTLNCKDVTAPVKARDGLLDLFVLVDRGSVEVFADGGRVAMSIAAIPAEKNGKLVLTATGGDMTLHSATVYRLKSAWGK